MSLAVGVLRYRYYHLSMAFLKLGCVTSFDKNYVTKLIIFVTVDTEPATSSVESILGMLPDLD